MSADYAAAKRQAKAIVASIVAGKSEVVVSDVSEAVKAGTELDLAPTTIAHFLKAEGFEKDPMQRAGSRIYRRV